MRRVSEGGSVLGFIVVAMVLAGLLVGGAYFINRQKDHAQPSVTEQPQEEKKPAENGGGDSQKPPEQDREPSELPQTTPQTGVVHELPTTGAGDVVVPLLMLGTTAGLLASYLRSRQAHLSL